MVYSCRNADFGTVSNCEEDEPVGDGNLAGCQPTDEYRYTNGAVVITIGRLDYVNVNGIPITLTPSSATILRILMQNEGRVVSRGQLFDELYGTSERPVCNKILEVFVYHLRSALEKADPEAKQLVETVWGRGYRLAASQSGTAPNGAASHPIELPHPGCRWTCARKAVVVRFYAAGKLTLEAVLSHYPDLTLEEFQSWVLNFERAGEKGLRTKVLSA